MERLTDKRIASIYDQLRGDGFDDAADVIEQLQADLRDMYAANANSGKAVLALQSDNAALRADVERLRGALRATKADFLAWAEIRGGLGTYRSAIERIDAALGAS